MTKTFYNYNDLKPTSKDGKNVATNIIAQKQRRKHVEYIHQYNLSERWTKK